MRHFTLMILCLFSAVTVLRAQNVEVRGTVYDETGAPFQGVSVEVKNTTIGQTTDFDGKFRMNVPENSTLVFSFLGYSTIEMAANPNADMVVRMGFDVTTIHDVVVTGITTTDKRLFSGAANRMVAEDIVIGGIADVSRSLEGRAAGVSVQNVSGTFGTAPKIQIRGATSIYGNSKPLWVVDGVIMEDVADISTDQLTSGDAVTLIGNAIAGLNADDIATFDILKDGSATSIYGARAMSGVIVITTKRGTSGIASINYTGEFTTRLKPNYANFNIMNSQDQMSVYQELEEKGWLNYASVYRAQESGVYGQMYRLIHQWIPEENRFGLANTTAARNAFLREAEMRNTDWFDLLFSNSIQMNHSVSISQGSERANSYVSVSAMNDPGWTKASEVSRYTLNANSQYKLYDNFTLSLLGNASYRKQTAPGTVSLSTDPVNGVVSRDFDINPYSYALNTSRTMGPDDTYIRNYTGFNIFQELENNYIQMDVIDAKFQGEAKWVLFKNLTLSGLASTRYQSSTAQHIIKDDSNYARAYREMSDATVRDRNPWLYTDPDVANSLPITILDVGGFYEKREYKMWNHAFRGLANYKETFNNDHAVDILAGAESNIIRRTSDWFRGIGMQYDNGEIPFFNYLAFKKMREENTNYYSLLNTVGKNVAFFGTANYSYRGKYSFLGTLRYEGSNRLGKVRTARWLPTWNVSGAWNVHEEDFFASLRPSFSHLKLRASYSLTAETGPDWVSNSAVIITNYTPWRPSASLGETGLEIADLENSELTYEKKHEFNVGADLGFLDNRLNVVVDYYTRNMYDLIGLVSTMGAGGVISRYANNAEMKAQGVEATISSLNIRNQDFSWSTDFTFAYNSTKITKLKSYGRVMDLISGTGYQMEGYAHSSLFSIPFAGLDEEGLPTFLWKDESDPTQTIIINKYNYGDLDFQNREDNDFLKYEGPTTPTITGGLGNTLNYKNFRINIFFTYAFGGKVRLDPVFSSTYNDGVASPTEFNNRWRLPGDELLTDVPTIVSARQNNKYNYLNMAYNAYNYSSARVAKSDFIRLKEVSLTYVFPKNILDVLKVKQMSVTAQATNMWLLYSDKALMGQDPEFFRSGGVAVPMPQQFTFTVRLGF